MLIVVSIYILGMHFSYYCSLLFIFVVQGDKKILLGTVRYRLESFIGVFILPLLHSSRAQHGILEWSKVFSLLGCGCIDTALFVL